MTVPTSCLEGFVLNDTKNPAECTKCLSNCDKCSLTDALTKCITCKAGYKLTSGIGPAGFTSCLIPC